MLVRNRKNSFGLDISEKTLRLIQITTKGRKRVIESENELNLPLDTIIDGEIKKPEMFIKSLHGLIQTTRGKKIKTNEVMSVLPESKTFIKMIKINAPSYDDTPSVLEQEIPKHIPLPLEEIYYDWQLFHDFHPNKNIPVLIGAAPKNIVENYTSVLKKAKLIPIVLEIEAASIVRSLFPENIVDANSKIIIDFGGNRTSLIVIDHGVIQFTVSLPISGSQITKTISEGLKIDHHQAEKAKIICGLDETRCEGVLKKILFSTIDKLIYKIEDALSFYKDQFPEKSMVEEIVLVGGGANFLNIDKVIYDRIKIPVKIGNPLCNINKITKGILMPSTKALSFSTTIGLALRNDNNK